MDFLGEVEGLGAPIVPVAHNERFDRVFLDTVLRRYDIGVKKGGRPGHFRLPAAGIDTLSLARRVEDEAKGYGLDDLAIHFGLIEEKRKTHGSLDDSRLTAQVLSELVRAGEFTRVNELLGDDLLFVNDPIQLSASHRRFTARFELEKPKGRKLVLREKDRATGLYGEDERVLDMDVVQVLKDKVEVSILSGNANNPEQRTAFMKAEDAMFSETGRFYHELVEAGFNPKVDASKRPKRKRAASVKRAEGAMRDLFAATEAANSDSEEPSGSKAKS
ncbi:MAG: hypothetical protein AAFY60_13695, partial [Myxococcota bacterium]